MINAFANAILPNTLNILMVGDVVGRPGRKILKNSLRLLREAFPVHFVTVNGENLAGGFGITEKIFHEMQESGVGVITMGNHWHDKPDVHRLRTQYQQLVLPQNLMDLQGVDHVPSFDVLAVLKDFAGVSAEVSRKISVINLMGNFAMKHEYHSPFAFLEKWEGELRQRKSSGQHVIIADIHAEASSEKQAIAWYFDGIIAGLIGTHTHTPTADERITRKGTAFVTDVGMTGPYHSIIGMSLEKSLKRYFGPKHKGAHEVGEGDSWFCGFLLQINPATNLCCAAHRLQYRESINQWSISSCFHK